MTILGYGYDPYGIAPYGSWEPTDTGVRIRFYASLNNGSPNTDYELISIDGAFMGDVLVPPGIRRRDYRKFFVKNDGTVYLRDVKIAKDVATDVNEYVWYAKEIGGEPIPRDGNSAVVAGGGPGAFILSGDLELGDIAPGGYVGVWVKREIFSVASLGYNTVESHRFDVEADYD